MNRPYTDEHGQFPMQYPQQQPPPGPMPPRRGMDKTTWFGICAGIVSVFIAGAAFGSTVVAQSAPAPAPTVTVAATQATLEVTPQSCIDAIRQSSAYIVLMSKGMDYANQGIGAALDGDAVAMDALTKEAADLRGSMELISPLMTASSAECRAKAK